MTDAKPWNDGEMELVRRAIGSFPDKPANELIGSLVNEIERLRGDLRGIATNKLGVTTNQDPVYRRGVEIGLAMAAAMARKSLGEDAS